MIPGSNLLNIALRVIARQTVIYYKDRSRSQNSVGQDVTSYAGGVPIVGSFQPVPRQLYEKYGLDLQKDYYTFYTSNNVLDVSRNVSGDQIGFKGERFQCESSNDWFPMDGWVGVLCVKIGIDTATPNVWGLGTTRQPGGNQNFGNGGFIGQVN